MCDGAAGSEALMLQMKRDDGDDDWSSSVLHPVAEPLKLVVFPPLQPESWALPPHGDSEGN